MNNNSERRVTRRVPRMERLFLRTIDERGDPPIIGSVTHCISEDLSADGMRLRIDRPLALGTRLQLWIKLYGQRGTFMLEGLVRWVEADRVDEETYLIGVELTTYDPRLAGIEQGWPDVVAKIAS